MSQISVQRPKPYILVAVISTIITLLEVSIISWPESLPRIWFLYCLALINLGIILSVFMHLKYESKILTTCFASGFFMALGTMVSVIALISYQPSLKAATPNTKTSVPSIRPSDQATEFMKIVKLCRGDAKAGAEIFSHGVHLLCIAEFSVCVSGVNWDHAGYLLVVDKFGAVHSFPFP
ncbi:MAG: cytochrome C oxidase subunit IV family protein [Pseudomonadota bacterium]